MWLQTLSRAGSLDRNLAAAERAASTLEPYASDPAGLSVLGMLTLTTALTAATLQRGDAASRWLDEAATIAARIPDTPMCNWQSFSATNVGIWRVTVGVERGEAGGAVRELAEQVRLGRLEAKSTRRASFFADVGRGLAREPGTRAEAVRWLRRAEEAAPQRIRNNSAARESVAYLLSRGGGDSGMADDPAVVERGVLTATSEAWDRDVRRADVIGQLAGQRTVGLDAAAAKLDVSRRQVYVLITAAATSPHGRPRGLVPQERGPLRRAERLQDDEHCHADRLVQGRAVPGPGPAGEAQTSRPASATGSVSRGLRRFPRPSAIPPDGTSVPQSPGVRA